MGGNLDTARTELRVLGRLVVDGDPGNLVTLKSAAGTPAPGDWYGVHLLPSSSSSAIEHALIRHAQYGVHSQADNLNSVAHRGDEQPEPRPVRDPGRRGLRRGPGPRQQQLRGLRGDGLTDAEQRGHVRQREHRPLRVQQQRDQHRAREPPHGVGQRRVRRLPEPGRRHPERDAPELDRRGERCLWDLRFRFPLGDARAQRSLGPHDGQLHQPLGGPGLAGRRSPVRRHRPGQLPPPVHVAGHRRGRRGHGAHRGLREAARPIDGNGAGGAQPDMGAYEYNPSANKWPITPTPARTRWRRRAHRLRRLGLLRPRRHGHVVAMELATARTPPARACPTPSPAARTGRSR